MAVFSLLFAPAKGLILHATDRNRATAGNGRELSNLE
jgi:hypothetical protein